MIEFIFEDIESFELKEESIMGWVESTIEKEDKIPGDICFIFCSDSYLLNINQQYLNHNYYTDVITFDYNNNSIVSGDIFISRDRILDNSKQYNVSFDYELLRIIIHGVLHLLGFNDKLENEKKIMTSREDESLKRYYDVEGI